jgi:ATP/maltotriose-dependent transcriptional regulator MalT
VSLARFAEPFVGRAAELAALAEAYSQVSSGRSRIVCVEGPAGIGKTALVRAFLAAAAPPVVISASGDDAEAMLRWGVLAQLGRGASAPPGRPFRELGELAADADPVAAGHLLLDALGQLSSEVLTVLVVEDLHCVDHSSAAALRFALRRLSTERILSIVTMRLEGPAADEGWRRSLGDRGDHLRLGGLPVPEVAQLLAAHGAGASSQPMARRLWQHTRGNPLYARCLIEEHGPQVLTAATGPLPAPRSLATQLAAVVAACATGTQDLISAAAVLGERCPLALAASLADASSAADALGEAQAAGLLAESYHEGVRQMEFPDPMVRAAIYFGLSPARRVALHTSAARICAGAVALSHRVAATVGPDAALAAELAEAARAESAAGRDAVAADHLMNAANLSPEPALREDRLLSACGLWLRSGAVHEVASRRGLLESLAPSPRRDQIRGFLVHLEGRPDEARRAWRAAAGQPRASAAIDVQAAEAAAAGLASLALLDCDWQAALALGPAAPRVAGGLPLLIRSVALAMAGRSADARKLLGSVQRSAAQNRGRSHERLARGFVAAWSDELPEAKRDLEEIAGQPADFGGSLRPTAQWLLADVYYRMGSFDEAMAAAELARSMLLDTGRAQSPDVTAAHAVAAYSASARGDWADARDHATAAQERAAHAASSMERAAAAAARWSLAVALDDPQQMLAAASALEEATDAPELSVFPVGAAMAEALWRNKKLDEAAARLAIYEGRARQLSRVSALVSASRVRGLLEASRHDKRAALRAFDEAAPMAERLPQPLEVARFMAAHGAVLAWLGRRAAATSKTRDARNILEGIGARPYLRRADEQLRRLGRGPRQHPQAGGLTASESVVARLVASGLSNKQTAEELMVSVKAVEFHLANIYAKLGVSSRSQLAARRDSLAVVGPPLR